MQITSFDHLVLNTDNLAACLEFYGEVLGMEIEKDGNRYALHFGQQKINIHTKAAEFLPAADNPQSGSLDMCLVIAGSIDSVHMELVNKGVALETSIVERKGAKGKCGAFICVTRTEI